MSNFVKRVEEANFVVEVARICPDWIKNILNKPYEEVMTQALERIKFHNLNELNLDEKVLSVISKHGTELKKINRQLIKTDGETTVLVQNFGNGIAYLQKSEDATKKISSAYYLDTQSQTAADILSLDPTINYHVTTTPPDQFISDQWYAEVVGRDVYFSGDTDFGWVADQQTKEITNLTAPAHEIGHVLQHDALKEESPLHQFPIILKNWAEAFRGTVARSFKLLDISPNSLLAEDVEMIRAAYLKLRNYDDDERGSSNERYAALFSLMFARKCRINNVNLFRAQSQSAIVLSTNDMLHSTTL